MKNFFITDGEDLKGVKHPTEIKYLRVVRSGLLVLSAWPFIQVGQKKPKGYLMYQVGLSIYCTMCPIVIFLYLVNHTHLDFLRLGHIYITAFMVLVCVTRYPLSIMNNYKDLVHRFFNEFHLFHHKERSDYAMKIHMQVHKLSHLFTMYLTCIMLVGIFLFNATPLYNNITNGAFNADNNDTEYELSIYVASPFNPETTLNGYIIVNIYDWAMSITASLYFCAHDLYLSLNVFHVWGHLKILKQSLESFPMPQKKVGQAETEITHFSDEEMDEAFERLKGQIKHHYFISDYATRMSDTYGLMLFFYYAFHQVSGCLLLLECSELDPKALTRYGPLTIILFQQLIQLSIIFELIGSESEKLIDAVYSVPWQCMDTRSRKLVLFFLRNVQTPIRLKALGVCDVGVQTMASVLKTSFSYFTFLRTM